MMTIVFVTVIEEIMPISFSARRIRICSFFISITSLWEILISPLSRRLTAYDIHVAQNELYHIAKIFVNQI